MIPVMLDPKRLRIGLAGRGALAVRRLNWFRDLGATPDLYSDAPSVEFLAATGDDLVPRLPDAGDLAALDLLWIADLEPEAAADLAARARRAKVIVNVEDVLEHCDLHTPAVVKRGRLVLAAGTGGASPAVASAVRAKLEEAFPADWAAALEDIAAARATLRAAGLYGADITADAKARLKKVGLT